MALRCEEFRVIICDSLNFRLPTLYLNDVIVNRCSLVYKIRLLGMERMMKFRLRSGSQVLHEKDQNGQPALLYHRTYTSIQPTITVYLSQREKSLLESECVRLFAKEHFQSEMKICIHSSHNTMFKGRISSPETCLVLFLPLYTMRRGLSAIN